MPDLKISQLTAGSLAQAGDEIPIARSGANYKITGADIAAAATSVGTLTSLTVSGDITASAGSSTDPSITFSGYTNWGFGIDGTGLRMVAGGAGTTTTFTTAGLTTSNAVVSGDLTVDTSTLKVDSANNRVGIGTASPDSLLYVQAGALGGLRVAFNGTSENYYDADKHTFRVGSGSILAFETTSNGSTAFDTNTLYVDAANNRVGVGTASPGYLLDVRGSSPDIVAFHNGANGSRVGITATNTAAYIGTTYSTNDIPLIFTRAGIGSSGSELMRLDTSGNLGLGVTPSAWDASYKAATVNGFSVASQDASGGSELSKNSYVSSGGTQRYVANGYATKYEQSAGGHKFFTAASGTAGNAITFTQAMTLDASGNLGVGTTSPSSFGLLAAVKDQTADTAIAVGNNGTINASTSMSFALAESGSKQGWFRRYRDGTGNTEIGFSDALLFTGSVTGTKAERARIPAAGGMVVGTAAIATTATDGFLYVPTCAGTPTGTPTTQTGTAPIVVDTTNNKLYFYSGGSWRDAGP